MKDRNNHKNFFDLLWAPVIMMFLKRLISALEVVVKRMLTQGCSGITFRKGLVHTFHSLIYFYAYSEKKES